MYRKGEISLVVLLVVTVVVFTIASLREVPKPIMEHNSSMEMK